MRKIVTELAQIIGSRINLDYGLSNLMVRLERVRAEGSVTPGDLRFVKYGLPKHLQMSALEGIGSVESKERRT